MTNRSLLGHILASCLYPGSNGVYFCCQSLRAHLAGNLTDLKQQLSMLQWKFVRASSNNIKQPTDKEHNFFELDWTYAIKKLLWHLPAPKQQYCLRCWNSGTSLRVEQSCCAKMPEVLREVQEVGTLMRSVGVNQRVIVSGSAYQLIPFARDYFITVGLTSSSIFIVPVLQISSASQEGPSLCSWTGRGRWFSHYLI